MKTFYRFSVLVIISIFVFGCAVQEKMSIDEKIDKERQPQVEEIKARGFPIAINSLGSVKPNSAGGASVRFSFFPVASSSNPIKYVRITVTPYNAVGDMVGSSIGDKTKTELQITGPLYGHERSKTFSFGEVWYNHSIDRVNLNKLEVEMMNGTIYTYEESFHSLATSNFKLFFNDDGSSTGYKISFR